MKIAKILLIGLLVISLAYAKPILTVTSPEKLVALLGKNNPIDCELANFGSVPYGAKSVGELTISNPYNGCQKTAVSNSTSEVEYQKAKFFLVERGGCAFADKAIVAQDQQASVVIIVDNTYEKGKIVMIDNGHGADVHIPSVFINKENGYILKQFAEENKHEVITMTIDFLQTKSSESLVRLWIDLHSPSSNKLVHSFNQYRKQISDNNIKTEPYFNIEQRKSIKKNDSDCITVKGIQFCTPDPDLPQKEGEITNRENVSTGKHVIEEVSRQMCIFAQGEDYWFQYLELFGTCFFEPQYYNTCGQLLTIQVSGLDQDKLKECIASDNEQKKILENQAATNNQYRIFEWPAVTINEMLYRGNLDGNTIAKAVCSSLDKVTESCEYIMDPTLAPKGQEPSHIFMTLLMILIGFVILFFLMTYIYKRIVRKEITQDMNQQVNQMVSQYIAFYESRGKSAGESQDNI